MMKWYKVFDSKDAALEKVEDQKAILLKIGDKRISLARFKKEIFATADKCPHNGDTLSSGQVNYLGEIICPWHNYRFNLKSGRECEDRSPDVETFPIEVRSEGLFIGIPQ